MTRYRNSNLSKTLKDYAVPFVWLFLILVLLYGVFSTWDTTNSDIQEDNIDSNINLEEVKVSLNSSDSEAYIVYENWKKLKIESDISLQKSDKVVIESWSVNIDFPLLAKMKLWKNGELTYSKDGSLFLESWSLWLESKSNIDFFMKFAEVSIPSWNIVSFYQTELESFIYSIDWNTVVTNLWGVSSKLSNMEEISIKSKDSSSTDINLDTYKKELNDFFKLSAWFKENNWDELLNNQKEESLTGSLLWDKKSEIKDLWNLMSFDNITDESYVKTNSIDLTWRYSPLKVWKITINNISTKLDSELWIFSLKWFKLLSKTNDLVVKTFDKDLNLISKKVLTIYSNNSWISPNIDVKTNKTLENFPVKATDFYIYEPTKTGKITTKSSQLTIRWKVNNSEVTRVLVNWYSLKSYNGSTWRYHAFVEQGTLKNWANNYEIKYLDKDWKLVYKEYYSIYKEFVKPSVKKVKKISDEATIN